MNKQQWSVDRGNSTCACGFAMASLVVKSSTDYEIHQVRSPYSIVTRNILQVSYRPEVDICVD